jgi:transcriptional regulator with XRE-family HTH domain
MIEEPEDLSIGELLRARREELEMTVRQLAEQVGTTAENITQYEAGIVPPPELRRKLQKALDLKLKAINAAMGETVRRRKQRKTAQPLYSNTFREGIDLLRVAGHCPCKDSILSSVDVLLLRCRAEKRNGNGRCKLCVVLKSKGLDLANGIKIVPLAAHEK